MGVRIFLDALEAVMAFLTFVLVEWHEVYGS